MKQTALMALLLDNIFQYLESNYICTKTPISGEPIKLFSIYILSNGPEVLSKLEGGTHEAFESGLFRKNEQWNKNYKSNLNRLKIFHILNDEITCCY